MESVKQIAAARFHLLFRHQQSDRQPATNTSKGYYSQAAKRKDGGSSIAQLSSCRFVAGLSSQGKGGLLYTLPKRTFCYSQALVVAKKAIDQVYPGLAI